MDEPSDIPASSSGGTEAAESPPAKEAVQLDPAFQARLLEQMREEQETNGRRTAILNWIVLPLAILALLVGIALAFSDDAGVALLANFFASSLAYLLYRINRPRIRAFFGLE